MSSRKVTTGTSVAKLEISSVPRSTAETAANAAAKRMRITLMPAPRKPESSALIPTPASTLVKPATETLSQKEISELDEEAAAVIPMSKSTQNAHMILRMLAQPQTTVNWDAIGKPLFNPDRVSNLRETLIVVISTAACRMPDPIFLPFCSDITKQITSVLKQKPQSDTDAFMVEWASKAAIENGVVNISSVGLLSYNNILAAVRKSGISDVIRRLYMQHGGVATISDDEKAVQMGSQFAVLFSHALTQKILIRYLLFSENYQRFNASKRIDVMRDTLKLATVLLSWNAIAYDDRIHGGRGDILAWVHPNVENDAMFVLKHGIIRDVFDQLIFTTEAIEYPGAHLKKSKSAIAGALEIAFSMIDAIVEGREKPDITFKQPGSPSHGEYVVIPKYENLKKEDFVNPTTQQPLYKEGNFIARLRHIRFDGVSSDVQPKVTVLRMDWLRL